MFISKKRHNQLLEQLSAQAWSEGFETGSKKTLPEARKVFIKRIEKEITTVSNMVDIEYIDGLKQAIDIIKRSK